MRVVGWTLLLSLVAATAAAQEEAPPGTGRTLTGRVIDAQTREGVPLATVLMKSEPPVKVVADVEGRFAFAGAPDGAVTVRAFAADYLPLDVTVPAGQDHIEIAIATSYLEEIVVVGRATEVARRNLANSVSTVKGEDLAVAPAQTVDAALQGKIAGANIQSNSGAPGGGLQLKMRGISTINGRSDPLYVVDGILVSDVAIPNGINAVTRSSAGSNTSSNQDGQVNRIADLNPEDIESIEVLKGASAAAMYGSKASNGVVIITTKRGRITSEEPRVQFTQRVGVYQVANKLGARRFNSVEEAVAAFGATAAEHYQPGVVFDHEQELAGRTDPSTETAISLSGAAGGGRTRYYASGLIRNDEGIIANTGHQKQSLRLNLDQKLGDRIDVRLSSNLIHTDARRSIFNNDNSGTSHYMVLAGTPSFLPLGSDDLGNFPANPFVGSRANPLQTASLMRNNEDVWRLLGALDASVDVWRSDAHELKLTGLFGVDRFQQKNGLFFPPELHFEPVDDGLPGTALDGTSENLFLNGALNVVHLWRPGSGPLNNLTMSMGIQQEERHLNSTYVVSRNLNGGQQNLENGTQVTVTEQRQIVRDRGAYLQAEGLLFNERLTLSAAVLGEQSSANGNPLAIYFYPKVAGAFRVPGLPKAIDELKLRLAYGEAGNLPLYGQKFTALLANRNIEGSPGTIVSGIAGDPNIRPERQREVEAGLDLVAGEALVELTVYQRAISDLLLQRTLAPSTGFTTQFFNGGGLVNRGVELMLQHSPVKNERLEWTSRLTFALNRSEITDLPVPAFSTGGFGTSLGSFRIEEGQSATRIVGNAGLREDGTCCVVGTVGDVEPTFRLGFSNALRWGGFRASFLLDWQQGSSVINLTRFLYDLAANAPDWEAGNERLRRWSQDYDTGVYVEDATFLKLRELSLSYDLPARLFSAVGALKSARLSVSGRNLLTLDNYSGLDPEVSNFGNQPIARNIDVAPFPPSRSYWASIELGF